MYTVRATYAHAFFCSAAVLWNTVGAKFCCIHRSLAAQKVGTYDLNIATITDPKSYARTSKHIDIENSVYGVYIKVKETSDFVSSGIKHLVL